MLPMNKYAIVTSDDTHWTAYAEQYSPETGSVSFFVEGHVFTTIANVVSVTLVGPAPAGTTDGMARIDELT
ncbi:MAG: hypothetical protein V4844_21920 [Pseudomonadota bacterium]|jgi:hypothetical protein